MKHTLTCQCDTYTTVETGTVGWQAAQTKYLPVMDTAGEIRWFCPSCKDTLIEAARPLVQFLKPPTHMLPPWLLRAVVEGPP